MIGTWRNTKHTERTGVLIGFHSANIHLNTTQPFRFMLCSVHVHATLSLFQASAAHDCLRICILLFTSCVWV